MGRDITESERLRRALKEYSANLEQLVAERTRELETSYTKLAESARLAGKAEVAAGVLHNIGNAINSIGVRLDMVKNHVHHHCGMEVLAQTLSLIEQNRDRLGPFWLEDPKGSKILPLLQELVATHFRSREELKDALRFVQDQVQHIAEIMAVEQRYHRPGMLTEPTDLNRLIGEALEMMKDSMGRRGVAVEQDLAELPLLKLDRGQMMQVVFNLLKNAAEALEKNPAGERRVKVSTRRRPEPESGMEMVVEDNGLGIRIEDRPRLFQFGFTTKADRGGHGFGLHASANFIQSLGGVIEAESEGPGQGAIFRVRLPLLEEPEGIAEALGEKETHNEPAYFGH
jgi:signal transduction histidine kinase